MNNKKWLTIKYKAHQLYALMGFRLQPIKVTAVLSKSFY